MNPLDNAACSREDLLRVEQLPMVEHCDNDASGVVAGHDAANDIDNPR